MSKVCVYKYLFVFVFLNVRDLCVYRGHFHLRVSLRTNIRGCRSTIWNYIHNMECDDKILIKRSFEGRQSACALCFASRTTLLIDQRFIINSSRDDVDGAILSI